MTHQTATTDTTTTIRNFLKALPTRQERVWDECFKEDTPEMWRILDLRLHQEVENTLRDFNLEAEEVLSTLEAWIEQEGRHLPAYEFPTHFPAYNVVRDYTLARDHFQTLNR